MKIHLPRQQPHNKTWLGIRTYVFVVRSSCLYAQIIITWRVKIIYSLLLDILINIILFPYFIFLLKTYKIFYVCNYVCKKSICITNNNDPGAALERFVRYDSVETQFRLNNAMSWFTLIGVELTLVEVMFCNLFTIIWWKFYVGICIKCFFRV